MVADNEWLDEDTEMMKKIPSEEKRIASFWLRRDTFTLFRLGLFVIGLLPAFLFVSGRGGPMIDLGIEGMVGSYVFAFIVMAWLHFLGRNEKGHIDIYPEMIVFYDYDPDRREARPCQFYYWSDVVQYHQSESYAWIKSKDSEPVNVWLNMNKLCPYFEQYAPHAEVVRFNMKRYFEEREKKQSGQDEEK